MAKFKSDVDAVIYHPTKPYMIAQFRNGILETDNPFIIQRLRDLGYKEFTKSAMAQRKKPNKSGN